ncbi:tetratricopeptide repeat protein [Pseudomonas cremoricolorata]|uniref:tetratricopeptide repeat protein n=1 Tax=Pseudomonas cremoricolorata TaxID=157783 RepID=UPI0006768489|nr:SEL1-like repeat protein [Pseudomonas cremoricolorata]
MYKSALIVMAALALTACASPNPSTHSAELKLAAVRCMLLTETPPVKASTVDYVMTQAERGNTTCMKTLGKLYRHGKDYGVSQNFTKARRLFRAVSHYDPSAYAELGQMAEKGQGQPVDYSKARELYHLAGEPGAVQLGQLVEAGKGGPKDVDGALALYMSVMRRFDDEAWNNVARLRSLGQPFNAVQRERYQDVWVRGVHERLGSILRSQEVVDAFRASGQTDEVRTARLFLTFTADSGKPRVRLSERTGDARLDAALLNAASTFSMGSFAPFTEKSGEVEVIAPVIFATPFER